MRCLDFLCAFLDFFVYPRIRFVLYHDIIRATGLKRSVALVLLRPIVAFLGGFVGVHPEDGVVVLGSKGLAGGFWQAKIQDFPKGTLKFHFFQISLFSIRFLENVEQRFAPKGHR